MATPGMSYFGLTSDKVVNSMTTGYYWVLGPDRTVDWAVSGGLYGEYWADPASLATSIARILNTYSHAANIKFNYVGSFANPVAASQAGSELTVTLSGSPTVFSSPYIWARAYFPTPQYAAYPGQPGDVFLNINSQANYLTSYAPGSAGWFVFLHEIGHALGLKHTHDDGGTGRPTLAEIGLPALDEDWASVMSYGDDYDWNLRSWDPITPMALDLIALQYMYGKNMATNAGDSTFDLVTLNAYGTIWDASGNDTASAATSWQGWTIMLPDEPVSSLVDTKVGFAAPSADVSYVAPKTLFWLMGDIENAVGSNYGDLLIGSAGANRMTGGFGNDAIDGRGGIDVAVYSGAPNQYTILRSATTVTISGPDGVDTLQNIERLQISSSKYAIDIEGHGGQAYRLYKAAFDRAPDAVGLGFWINSLDLGVALNDVAQGFVGSAEFSSKYGNLTDASFVSRLYLNVLHRAGEQGGLDFWTGHLAAHELTRAETLAFFSESPENQAAVIGVIQNGMFYA